MAQSKTPPDEKLREAVDELTENGDSGEVVTVLRREANRIEKLGQ